MPELTIPAWDAFILDYPDAHLLQTSAWGALKSEFGWEVARFTNSAGDHTLGAQVLFRRLPLGYSIAYLPKGPVGDLPAEDWFAPEAFWTQLDQMCKRRKAIFLKVEPDTWESEGSVENERATILARRFRRSEQSIQAPRTLVVSLAGDEDQILSRMKQKTRYNIRLALKKGVVVRASSDVDVFYRLMQVTGERDAFGVHSLDYYRRVYELFHPLGQCELLLAEYQGEPLAGLMVFAYGARAWYFYGASSNEQRQRMPTYLLQWEAMRWARKQGCLYYDLWGVPDADLESLEASFTGRHDGLWGVYRFKRGFGGDLKRSSGPWDRVYAPGLYLLYRWWLRARAPRSGAG